MDGEISPSGQRQITADRGRDRVDGFEARGAELGVAVAVRGGAVDDEVGVVDPTSAFTGFRGERLKRRRHVPGATPSKVAQETVQLQIAGPKSGPMFWHCSNTARVPQRDVTNWAAMLPTVNLAPLETRTA